MPKHKELYVPILAGKYKGKKLLLPSLSTTRSTKSIIKEALFNSIQFDIVGKDFIEVFGGSGSIGLEAISRGAKEAYFIEIDKKAYEILCKNATNIDKNHTHTICADSFQEYPRLIDRLGEKAFIYFDPPFDIREGMDGIYQKVIDLIQHTPTNKVIKIIIEHMTSIDMPKKIGSYKKVKFKKYGRSALTYYEVE